MSEQLFDSIVMAEEIFHGEGYKEGYERGAHRGLQEGRRHGAMHGARLCAEVSFYHGFAVMWKCLLQNNKDPRSRKRAKALEVLLCLLENSPLDDPHSERIKEDMDKLRAKFRQVCSMLNVPADFHNFKLGEGTSF
ncbi:protein LTO1 homolog [Eucyclogobius newberryi]|uniref:protein LTO1 homolog n=1 Tax=Eucyclogobius newberryi TaxID=166745 RepID=UPI003B593012